MEQKTARICGTANDSIVDGPGIRYVIFFQGCYHNCPGCHNPSSHALDGGYLITIDRLIEQIESNPLLDGITFSGGEPMLQANACLEIISRIKHLSLSIMMYTGFTFEEIQNMSYQHKQLFRSCDIVVDGKFEEDKKSLTLLYRGSSNQRIINTKKSIDCCNEFIVDEYGILKEEC